jgi:hypothetical protein
MAKRSHGDPLYIDDEETRRELIMDAAMTLGREQYEALLRDMLSNAWTTEEADIPFDDVEPDPPPPIQLPAPKRARRR